MFDHALLEPFWVSSTMHQESFILLDRGNGLPHANLLFRPAEILSVSNGAGDVRYLEGCDFTVDRAAGRILATSLSRMPIATAEMLRASDGAPTRDWQSTITYTHAVPSWTGHVPAYAGARIPRTASRLRSGEPLTICVTGDSISEGYDGSGFHGVAPRQPPFAPLVASGLQQRYGSAVELHNWATAGWTAIDGRWDIARVTAANPDLVIVAYGMNDAGYAGAAEFGANVADIVESVRHDVPHAECILVSPMLPTPECHYVAATRFPQYRAALAALCGDGIVLADVTTLWGDIVARKDPHDLSGNGLNHPNDFGHRIYAQVILALLIDSDG